MFWVIADDADNAFTLDDFAVITHLLNACSDFHIASFLPADNEGRNCTHLFFKNYL